MPRFFIRRDGVRVIQDGYRDIALPVPSWVDPYWYIMGSEPEKMVIAELSRRGIYFLHVKQNNTLGGDVDPTWEADFLFPQYKIWMEVNGVYFHTQTGAIESDALRYATIEAAGWKVLVWWDFDILDHVVALADSVPEFHIVQPALQPANGEKTLNLPFYTGGLAGSGVDHLKGLRKALSGRARPPQYSIRYRGPSQRKPK